MGLSDEGSPSKSFYAMVIRRRKISDGVDEISMQVSYKPTDICFALQEYYEGLASTISDAFALSCPQTEQDIIHYLSHSIFKQYPEKYAQEFAVWGFNLALRHNFLVLSNNAQCYHYYLSPTLARRKGRPSKEREERAKIAEEFEACSKEEAG